jgi:hypothetical protein
MLLHNHHIDLIHHRLFNQQIIQTSLTSAKQLVNWFGAVQSQEYGMAKWSLGLRIPGLNDTDIEKAFNDGAILRTHVLRPTWHFVTPEDIRWMLELTSPRVHAFNAPHYKKMELDNKTLKRSKDVLVKSLQDGNFLTRTDIQAALHRSKIKVEGLRLVLLLMHAELESIICSGPRNGKQFTYALLNERTPASKSLTREEALFKLAERYFTSRSPATFQDFAWWSGLTVKDAKEGAAMLPANFIQKNIDGKLYVFNPNAAITPLTKQQRTYATFLMPGYDEYGISYRDRDALFVFKGRKIGALEKHGYNTVYSRMIIVDGRITGTWKPLVKGKTIELETNFFVPLAKIQQQLVNNAVKRYKSFFA